MILDIFSDTDRIHSYDKDLTQAAENIRILLQGTYARFNEATDPLIIEALIYRMKELETQYRFLIKKANDSSAFSPHGKILYSFAILLNIYPFSFFTSFLLIHFMIQCALIIN